MNFKLALEIGVDCGLATVGEAIYNIKLRVGQLFEVDEYKSLIEECKELNVNEEDSIEEWLVKLN